MFNKNSDSFVKVSAKDSDSLAEGGENLQDVLKME